MLYCYATFRFWEYWSIVYLTSLSFCWTPNPQWVGVDAEWTKGVQVPLECIIQESHQCNINVHLWVIEKQSMLIFPFVCILSCIVQHCIRAMMSGLLMCIFVFHWQRWCLSIKLYLCTMLLYYNSYMSC